MRIQQQLSQMANAVMTAIAATSSVCQPVCAPVPGSCAWSAYRGNQEWGARGHHDHPTSWPACRPQQQQRDCRCPGQDPDRAQRVGGDEPERHQEHHGLQLAQPLQAGAGEPGEGEAVHQDPHSESCSLLASSALQVQCNKCQHPHAQIWQDDVYALHTAGEPLCSKAMIDVMYDVSLPKPRAINAHDDRSHGAAWSVAALSTLILHVR